MNEERFILICTTILVLALSVSFIWDWHNYKNYEYSMKDIYYKQYSTYETFDVTIDNIRKEKGKEDIYEFSCSSPNNSGYDFKYSLPKSEYEEIIGVNSNSFSTNIYNLRFSVIPKLIIGFARNETFEVSFTRYAAFSESDYDKNETEQFAKRCLQVFNYASRHGYNSIKDTSLLPTEIEPSSVNSYVIRGEDLLSGMKKYINK